MKCKKREDHLYFDRHLLPGCVYLDYAVWTVRYGNITSLSIVTVHCLDLTNHAYITHESTLPCTMYAGLLSLYHLIPHQLHRTVWLCWLAVGVGSCIHDNGGCDQICIPSHGGRVECRCKPGYRLDINGRSCKGLRYELSIEFDETNPTGSRENDFCALLRNTDTLADNLKWNFTGLMYIRI